MRLVRNPLTYLLLAFSLFVYAPLLFSGLLLFVAEQTMNSGALLFLSAAFFLVFIAAAVYVQSLLFSYAQQSSSASIIDVFSGSRAQFWRVFKLDALILALLTPAIALWLIFDSWWSATLLILYSLLVAFAFLFTPRYIHKNSVFGSARKSLADYNRHTVRRTGIVVGLALLATLLSVLISGGLVFENSAFQVAIFVISNTGAILLGVSSFLPALFVPGWGGSLGIVIVERVITLLLLIISLHVVCAKNQKSD